ncbi:MAG: GNAT family N-acetyltransferase [Haliea sp.]|nr:MAG: GNAT family N-acetyltransferase [Haliea sp.]
MYTMPEPFEMRQVNAGDQVFLEDLYFSSREDMHHAVPDAGVLRQLIAMQRRAQQAGLEQNYPEAQHLVILHHGVPVGRAVVNSGPAELRLVDIAIAPAARRIGAARAVLRALQDVAVIRGLPVRLAVAKSNDAARKLYLGLGFTLRSEDPVVEEMAWTGGAA